MVEKSTKKYIKRIVEKKLNPLRDTRHEERDVLPQRRILCSVFLWNSPSVAISHTSNNGVRLLDSFQRNRSFLRKDFVAACLYLERFLTGRNESK